jgi:hypothetical protein
VQETSPALAAHDLADPLMAHAHDLGDGSHRQAVAVGLADGFVALGSQCFVLPLQGLLAPGVVLGEGAQAGAGFGGMAGSAGDLRIVRPIPASRLA